MMTTSMFRLSGCFAAVLIAAGAITVGASHPAFAAVPVVARQGLVGAFDAREIRWPGHRREHNEAVPSLLAKSQIRMFPKPVPGQALPPEASPTPQDVGGFPGSANAAGSATAPDTAQPGTPTPPQGPGGLPPPVIYHFDYVPPSDPSEGPPPNVELP